MKADQKDTTEMFDVIEVTISTRGIVVMTECEKTQRNAEAIQRMAIARRANGDNFFVVVPAGKYKDGDTYSRDA